MSYFRHIGGKLWSCDTVFKTKKEASMYFDSLKRAKRPARIIKTKSGYGVYTRR